MNAARLTDRRLRHGAPRRPARRAGGFTFIEILATLTLLAIVLPAVMMGLSISLSAAGAARNQSQASALAYGKLMEISAEGLWQQTALSGDFGPDWPEFKWTAEAREWDGVLQQLDVAVTWLESGRPRTITLSTLIESEESS
jgi:type II secretory pathway pseudopilin PulG